MALVRAAAFLVGLTADAISLNVLIEKFIALAAVFYLTHCYTPFHSRFNISGNSSQMPSMNS